MMKIWIHKFLYWFFYFKKNFTINKNKVIFPTLRFSPGIPSHWEFKEWREEAEDSQRTFVTKGTGPD